MIGRRPRVLNRKQRAFALAIAQGLSKAAAQTKAGYSVNRKNANLLLTDERVRLEIGRLRPSGRPDEIIERPLNPRQRAFARALAHGMSTREAFIAAGYPMHRHNDVRLANDPRVQAEVVRLRTEDQGVRASILNRTGQT